jgi:hypothetical protein
MAAPRKQKADAKRVGAWLDESRSGRGSSASLTTLEHAATLAYQRDAVKLKIPIKDFFHISFDWPPRRDSAPKRLFAKKLTLTSSFGI